MADGDAVEVAAEDLAHLRLGVAVGDLGRLAFDERGVAAQLGHARFEGAAGAGAAEEEQHGQYLVAQIGVGLAQSALALQVEGHVEDGLDFLFREVQVADQVSVSQVSLHGVSPKNGKPQITPIPQIKILNV